MLAQDRSDVFEITSGEDPAGGVLRRVENQQLGLGCDARFELGRVEREIPRLTQRQRHRHGAMRLDLRFVDREARLRIDHLIAGAVIGGAQDRVGDERLGAGADHDFVGRNLQPAHLTHVARRRFAQLGNAGRGGVAMLALADRLDGRILHVRGCMEIGLTDAERDDVLALAGELGHFGKHHEGVLGAERRGAAADLGHGGGSRRKLAFYEPNTKRALRPVLSGRCGARVRATGDD